MITALASRSIAAVLVVAGAAGLTWVLTAPEPVRSEEQPARAWIDRPLHGALLPLGPIEVVVHAFDPDGVATVRLEVDGVSRARSDTGSAVMVEASWTWEPSAVGTYELTVVGEDPSGERGQPAVVVVTIVDDQPPPAIPPSPSPSPAPSASPSPEATPSPSPLPAPTSPSPTPAPTTSPPATPTTAPTTPPPSPMPSPSPTPPACQPGQPTAVEEYPQGWFFTFEWSYTGCTPAQFQVQVSQTQSFVAVDRTGVVPGDQRSWQDDDPGWYQDCVTYYWRVRALDGDVAGPWSNVRSFAILECPH